MEGGELKQLWKVFHFLFFDLRPRFLDQYYQQFDQKVEPVLQETESTGRQHTIALAEELGGQQSESLVSQTIASPYIIPVPLPVDGEDTTGAPNKRAFIKGLGSSSSSSSTSYSSPASSAYSFPTGSYESPSTFINSDLPSYSASVPTEYSSVGSGLKQAASKYFGVATTNDQNIQLGLTFTVPFLSIPLNSLTNIFNSGGTSGLSGVSNFFNFDTSNLITIGVIAVAAIFILPQVIYWLTGVNLSAFNWGRSEFWQNLAIFSRDQRHTKPDLSNDMNISNVAMTSISKLFLPLTIVFNHIDNGK